jgi:predicted nucleic acid-binding Zn ribbon protein
MPTYIYETIPEKKGECAVRFEVKQSMAEDPLEVHPETGQAVKRVISGGFGHIRKSDAPPMKGPCGSNCGCFN